MVVDDGAGHAPFWTNFIGELITDVACAHPGQTRATAAWNPQPRRPIEEYTAATDAGMIHDRQESEKLKAEREWLSLLPRVRKERAKGIAGA